MEAATRYPNRVALRIGNESWTYSELLSRVRSFAERLPPSGAPQAIGVSATKSLLSYVALLAVMEAGHIYVPIGPNIPRRRIQELAAAARLSIFISDTQNSEIDIALDGRVQRLSEDQRVVSPSGRWSTLQPKNLAYLLFTSGSTGVPKGVAVTHENARAFVQAAREVILTTEVDVFTQLAPHSFDLSIGEMFLCWASGGTLVVPTHSDLLNLADYVLRNEITVWVSVPTLGQLVRQGGGLIPGSLPSLRLCIFCGEPLRADLAAAWACAGPNASILNAYGPTEATVFVTLGSYDEGLSTDATVPIGRPLAGTRIAIECVGEGHSRYATEGELLLSGPQLVDGYWHDSHRGASAFITKTEDGVPVTWYKTGDLVAQAPDGSLTFLNRLDRQVKVRGHRVNLHEIELALLATDGVKEAAVVAITKDGLCESTHAFCVGGITEPAIRLACACDLPDYMVPNRVTMTDRLPTTTSGKVDYSLLLRLAGPEA